MDNIYNLENSFHNNISKRSKEGQADKKIWRDYKASAVFIIVTAFILLFIENNYINQSYNHYDYFSFIMKFICVISIIITFIFLIEVDIAVNNYIKRKFEFYSLICAELIERYGYTENEMKDIKLKINAFQNNNKLKSAYFIPFGIYVPVMLTINLIIFLLDVGFGYRPDDIEVRFYSTAPFLIIIIYVFFFAVPLKKRVAVWYNINNDESKIVDEISNLLMQKNIIDEPISLEVKKQFKNPYWLILIAASFTIIGYIFMDSNLAAQEKQYLKMIYPIEDKLLEILGY